MAACLDSENVTTYMGNVYINHGILAICLGEVYSVLNIFEEEISMVGCLGHTSTYLHARTLRKPAKAKEFSCCKFTTHWK